MRSLVASSYSKEGGSCFDPASFFVLHLSRYLDEFKSEKSFISLLHDKDKGRCYRTYAGISDDRIPCEADFSNFKKRIGPQKFDEIFHVLVEIVKRVGLVTGKILILLTVPFSPPLLITEGAIMSVSNAEVFP